MFASSQNIENAFIYADKALAFAFERRLHSTAKQQKVDSKFQFSSVAADEPFRNRMHDKSVMVYYELGGVLGSRHVLLYLPLTFAMFEYDTLFCNRFCRLRSF